MSISKIRSLLYVTAKGLGWISAVIKGPFSIVMRLFRVIAGKGASRLFSKLFGRY